MVSNEALVPFHEIGDRRPKEGSMCDLVQQRWTNGDILHHSWTNIYCYIHPATIYDRGAMEVKYIKFIDFDRHLAFLDDSEQGLPRDDTEHIARLIPQSPENCLRSKKKYSWARLLGSRRTNSRNFYKIIFCIPVETLTQN